MSDNSPLNNKPQPILSVSDNRPSPFSACQTTNRSTGNRLQPILSMSDNSPLINRQQSQSHSQRVRQQSPAHSLQVRQQSPAHSLQVRQQTPAHSLQVRQQTPAHSQCQTTDPSPFSVCQTTDPSSCSACQTADPIPFSVCQTTDPNQFSVQTPAHSQCITVRQQSPAHSHLSDNSPQPTRLQPTVSVSDNRCQPTLRMSDNRPQPILSKSGSPKFHPCSSVVDLALGSCTKSMQSHSAACLQYEGNKSMSCMETLSRETAWRVRQEEGWGAGGSRGLRRCCNVCVCVQTTGWRH